MELDTGATRSLISEATYKKLFKNRLMEHSVVRLGTYSGEILKVVGEVTVVVLYGDQRVSLQLVVVDGDGVSLFGQNWLRHIHLEWVDIKQWEMVTCCRSSKRMRMFFERGWEY